MDIRSLAKEKDVLILAHYYQTMDIQGIADVVGDSFELARKAQAATNRYIMLCGVRFMAETAKILNPDKTVLLPAPDAGCPMADMIDEADVLELKAAHPKAAVVCYVNSTAAVKAVSDICVTSSSAERVVRSLAEDEIIFVPDQNLGAYVASKILEKTFHFFSGFCPIHNAVTVKDVEIAKRLHPLAKIIVHPECIPEVVALADEVGSTSFILQTVTNAPSGSEFVIGTEEGVVRRLMETAPDKRCFLLKDRFSCVNMKKTTIDDVRNALINLTPTIELSADEMDKARNCLVRMISV